jgi:hypothetical protein
MHSGASGVACLERVCRRTAPDAPERGYHQRRCLRCDQRTSCRGAPGSASLPAHRHRLIKSSNPRALRRNAFYPTAQRAPTQTCPTNNYFGLQRRHRAWFALLFSLSSLSLFTIPYGKTIQEKAADRQWGLQKCRHNKRAHSKAVILVPWRLALGPDLDAVRHAHLYPGLADGIYLGRRCTFNG